MPKKLFTMKEIETITAKVRIKKPLGIMDKSWNRALDRLMESFKKIADMTEDGLDPEDNIRLIKRPEKPKSVGSKLP